MPPKASTKALLSAFFFPLSTNVVFSTNEGDDDGARGVCEAEAGGRRDAARGEGEACRERAMRRVAAQERRVGCEELGRRRRRRKRSMRQEGRG